MLKSKKPTSTNDKIPENVRDNLTENENILHNINWEYISRTNKIMKYILEHSKFHFYLPLFKLAQKILGDRGVVGTYFARSAYMRLIIEYMGFERTILFLKKFGRR